MNADQLLAHYEQIADAPDAISRLRRFILDLAVRGKLVEQDPADEPASELLERIAAEKAQLVKAGEISKPKVLPPPSSDQLPYSQPINWQWVPLGSVLNNHLGGGTPSKSNPDYWDGDVYWASVKDVGKTKYVDETIDRITNEGLANSSSNLIPAGNLIVVTRMGLGKISINRVPVAINQDLRALFLSSFVDIDYVFMFFKTHAFEGTGLTVKGIKVGELLNFPFPLPPLAEQHRIVAKVDELMALCDRLEAARAEREATRDRLAAASLTQLNSPDPDPTVFRDHAAFVLDNLTPLTTRPDQIKALRQTILNLAVRGKLVPQDPTDEPASELLKRINREHVELEKSRSIKKSKPLPPVDITNAPFDLPAGWAWARFPEVGIFGRGKSKHRPRNDLLLFTDGKYPFIQTGDVARSGGLIETYTSFYNDVGLAQSAMWPAGTLCITIAANIADSGILSFNACFPDSVVGLIAHDSFEGARFFEYFIRTVKADIHEFAPSTAQKNINLRILMEVLIPLPPLAEKHRIVTKVDELMALCDRLARSLATGDDTRRRLLDALLHEALAPATDQDRAA